MSYTKSYYNTIEVRGEVSISFPASDTGGTKTVQYHQTVPIYTNIHVDTLPLDASITDANGTVDLLTGSVVALNAAQVAAIRESAEKVSDRMIKGFYGLISSDLTTQRAESGTAVKARFALLNQYGQAVLEKQERMESDVARIRSHYAGVFSELDKELAERSRELDREAFDLSEKVREKLILGSGKEMVPFCFEQNSRSGQVDGMMTMARLRSKTASVLSSVSDYVAREEDYAEKLDRILDEKKADGPSTECIPVILCKKNGEGPYEAGYECVAPEIRGKEEVISKVGSFAETGPESVWKTADAGELEKIDEAFYARMGRAAEEESTKDTTRERVYSEIRRLWEKNKETLKVLC